MRSDREAKRVLKAFGKEAYKERIRYVDSFLPEKPAFVGSISYRHTFRRIVTVALVVILIMALAVSVYAAVRYYFDYTRIEQPTNDEYISNNEGSDLGSEVTIYEPTYVPKGYELISMDSNEVFHDKEWIFCDPSGNYLEIWQGAEDTRFKIDNENLSREILEIGNIEVIVYSYGEEKVCLMQCGGTVIYLSGHLSNDEIERIIDGLILPD